MSFKATLKRNITKLRENFMNIVDIAIYIRRNLFLFLVVSENVVQRIVNICFFLTLLYYKKCFISQNEIM